MTAPAGFMKANGNAQSPGVYAINSFSLQTKEMQLKQSDGDSDGRRGGLASWLLI